MALDRHGSLPDGEFFMLKDERDDFNMLSGRTIRVPNTEGEELYDQHDRDPDRSRAISKARLQRHFSLAPQRKPTDWTPTLFDDRRFRFDAELLSPVSYFYGPPPQNPIHFDFIFDFAGEVITDSNGNAHEGSSVGYWTVSTEWKDAIEGLEPGVHEFFAHELDFCDYAISGHFIFRDCQPMEFIDLDKSGPGGVSTIQSGEFEGHRLIASDPVGLAAKRDLVRGRHWVRQGHLVFVSRTLATRLLDFIPLAIEVPDPAISFIPVSLV